MLRREYQLDKGMRGCSSVVEHQLPKLDMAVRFRSPAVLIFYFLLLAFCGCATVPAYTPVPEKKVGPGIPGKYHKVQKGQTLWKISRIYGIDVDEIARINRISDAGSLDIGQLIFIPPDMKPAYTQSRDLSSDEDFIWPVEGRVISGFGQNSNNMVNKGINIQPYTNNDVVAARGGKVVFCADNFKGFGKTIIIDHGDGFSSVYARNAQISVRAGDRVQKATAIAKVGSAGRDRNKYLYFQIRKGHIPKNPYFYLPR